MAHAVLCYNEHTMVDMPKTSPKDVFLHLLAILTLYASAIAFTTLLFQYINILVPDLLEYRPYARDSAYSSMRWAIASLVVIFPAFVATSWFLNKNYTRFPELRNLKIRKWLVYFTLFATALIIMGDLVALIYNLLQGELTTRFFLKIITIFFVAGSTFGYYFWDLRRYKTE